MSVTQRKINGRTFAVYTEVADHMDALAARLAEATALVRDALRYPHKPGSEYSTWDKRAFAFLRATDSADVAPAVCHWDQDGEDCDTWHTDCGNFFCIIDDTPTANEFRHCCYCGKPLVDRPWTDDDEDEGTTETVSAGQESKP